MINFFYFMTNPTSDKWIKVGTLTNCIKNHQMGGNLKPFIIKVGIIDGKKIKNHLFHKHLLLCYL